VRRYQVQVTDAAYGGYIPENAWRLESTHTSLRELEKAERKALRWRTPQPNSWSGHVQIIRDDGERMMIEDGRVFSLGVEKGFWL